MTAIDAALLQRFQKWNLDTFGPGDRTEPTIDHIIKELEEVRSDDGWSEWVDVVMLGMNGALRRGATPQELIDAFIDKLAVNEQRTWPDWRTADPGKAIEHIR